MAHHLSQRLGQATAYEDDEAIERRELVLLHVCTSDCVSACKLVCGVLLESIEQQDFPKATHRLQYPLIKEYWSPLNPKPYRSLEGTLGPRYSLIKGSWSLWAGLGDPGLESLELPGDGSGWSRAQMHRTLV